MPLALVAVGSALDRSRYDVVVIDGRLESNPSAALVAATEDAVCVVVSVLTGTPIRDALAATRAVREARPDCPIVWGGWHPSLFPLPTLDQAGLDAVVVGQGEDTFTAIVERLSEGLDLSGIDGCVAAPRLRSDRCRRLFPAEGRTSARLHHLARVPVPLHVLRGSDGLWPRVVRSGATARGRGTRRVVAPVPVHGRWIPG